MRRTRSGTTRESEFVQGEIVLVPFPYTDRSATKRRPALVLSGDAFNRSGPDIVVCGVTSNLSDSPFSVLIAQEDLESGRLLTPSRVKVGRVVALEKSVVIKRFGRLGARAMAQVMREFEAVFA